MKLNKILATVAASAISVSAFAAMSLTSANAAEKTIAYTASEGSLNTEDDGKSVRRNIYNTWGNNVADIDNTVGVAEYVKVNFDVVGIGTNSHITNEDGTEGDAYYVWLAGAIGADSSNHWKLSEIADTDKVAITGDGNYTVTWNLSQASATIDCLILSSNINLYNYGEGLEASGVSLNINSIVTDDGEVATEPTSEESTSSETTTTAANSTTAATTTAANGTTTATTTAANGTTTTAAAGEKSAATGDLGAGMAVAGLALAAGAAFVARKKN